MIAGSPSAPAAQGFQSLAPLLASYQPNKLAEARCRVAEFDRGELLARFGRDFENGKRIASFLLADELIVRSIPPCFWRSHLSIPARELDVTQRFDLMLYDLRWLRRWHPAQPQRIRYGRYRDLFSASEPAFHRAAEFVFYAGRRPLWKIVGSLSMTEAQQWECYLLRSAPINKRQAAIDDMRDRAYAAIQTGLASAGRTAQFTDGDAEIALVRRHALWLCSRMGDLKSPTQIAARYEQMTGRSITRQYVARQLELVHKALAKST
jgi:hypothetical protein